MSVMRMRLAWAAVPMLAALTLAQSSPPANKASATVAVRGISGIKGAKLINLEKALQLQTKPPPPPVSTANVASLVKGPVGPPPKEPPPPTDERALLEEVPPDEIGGS
jgi:hypothetical protein